MSAFQSRYNNTFNKLMRSPNRQMCGKATFHYHQIHQKYYSFMEKMGSSLQQQFFFLCGEIQEKSVYCLQQV